MKARYALLFAGVLAFGALSVGVAGAADEPKMSTLSAADQSDMSAKATLASGLISVGRAEKDPLMLAAAAKLLSQINAPVMDPASTANGGDPKNYDMAALITEAKGFAGTDKTILQELSSIRTPMAGNERRYCVWAWQCNYWGYCAYWWACR